MKPDPAFQERVRSLSEGGALIPAICRELGVGEYRVRAVLDPAWCEKVRDRVRLRRRRDKQLPLGPRKLPAGGEARWRGRLPIPKHSHPLVRRFVEILNSEDTLISEVAERSGYRSCTISSWRYRNVPRLDSFENALNVMGYELVIQPIPEGRA